MRSRKGSPLLALSTVVLLLLLHTSMMTGAEDTIQGTLEDYTAVNTGLPTAGEFLFCIMGDLNGDGFDDIAASASNNSRTSPVMGLRAYTSKAGTSWEENSTGLPTVDRYGGIGLGDMDGDGDLDMVAGIEVAEGSSNAGITVWLNNGTVGGKLSWVEGPQAVSTSTYTMVAVADIDDDDDLDIVAGTHSRGIRVYTGNGGTGANLQFTEASTGLPTWGAYTGVAVADMNDDGDADIVACDYSGGIEAHLYTGDGTGSWTSQDSSFPTPTSAEATMGVAVGDVNEDGDMDIVYGRRDNGVRCLLGNGGGSDGQSFCWTSADTGLPVNMRYSMVALADVDIDGDLDLLAACDNSNAGVDRGLELYTGDGGQGGSMDWTRAQVGLPRGQFYGVAFGDFNKDRVLDAFGSRYHRRGIGGLDAYRGSVTGAALPTTIAVWNGTEINETTIVLGGTVVLDGRQSYDAEDAPDGDLTGLNLTYDWNLTTVPTGSTLDEGDLSPSDAYATPSFTPDAVGNYSFTLAVQDRDGQWSVDEAFLELRVLKPNDPPVADAGPDRTVEVGTHVTLNGTASYDPDGSIVEWDWNASPSNPTTVDLAGANTSGPNFPVPDVVGVYGFTLRVLDDNGTWSAPDEVNVTVELPPNVVPTAVATAEQALALGDTVHLNGTGSYDADGYLMGWEWNCTSHPGLAISDAGASMATAVPGDNGTYVFTLRVLDDRGGWSEPATVEVLVVAPDVNLPPVAMISGPSQVEVTLGNGTTVDGSGSYDPDGEVVEYLWNLTSHPGLAFDGQNASSIHFTPPAVGRYVFTLAVRDDNGSWSLSESMVTIEATSPPPPPPPPPPPNEPPVAVIVLVPGEPIVNKTWLTLNGESSYDPDGEVVGYGWSCPSHPDLLDPGDVNTSRTAFWIESPGEYTFRLAVLDGNGSWSEPEDYVLTVVENLPPVVTLLSPGNGTTFDEGQVVEVRWEASDPNDHELVYTVLVSDGPTVLFVEEGLPRNVTSYNLTIPEGWNHGRPLSLGVVAEEVDSAHHHVGRANVDIFVTGPEEPGPPPGPPATEQEFDLLPWLILILVLAVVTVVVVVVLLTTSGRPALSPLPQRIVTGMPEGMVCPECGGPVDTSNAFGQPYCSRCDRYF